jgi:hypothetical protein
MAPRRTNPPRGVTPTEAGPSSHPTTEPIIEPPVADPREQNTPEPDDDEDDDDRGTQLDRTSPARDAHSPTPEESETQELLRRRARLAEILRRQRLREEIQAMEAEVAGETPTVFAEVAGTTLPTRKRQFSNTIERDREEVQKALRTVKPKYFGAKSMQQLHAFDSSWRTIFESLPYDVIPDWPGRVRTAANYLENRALDEWRRDRRENQLVPSTWDQFIAWCKDTIEDADVRKGEALEKLGSLKQSTSQSVRDLVHQIELLEGEVGPLNEDERKGWALFHALTPSLRDAVRRDLRTITSRAQVLASAQRLETTISKGRVADRHRPARSSTSIRETSRNTSGQSGRRGARDSQAPSERGSPAPPKKPRRRTPTPEHRSFQGECFNCNKKGHKEADCPHPKKSTASESQSKREGGSRGKQDKGRSKK